jgi:hypothetical protein
MPTSVITYGIALGAEPRLAENGISLSVSESGWDTMKFKYWGRTDTPATYAATHFATGMQPAFYPNMYFNGVTVTQEGSNIYSFDVQAAGLLGAQAVKRTVSSKIQSYKSGLGTVPGTGNEGEIQGQYINLSCTFHQVTEFFPNTATRPENAIALGPLPPPPTNPFTTEPTTPVFNFPFGWIQDGLEIETINGDGVSIYLVKQSMVYIYEYMPG